MSSLRILIMIVVAAFLLSSAMALAQGTQLPCRLHGTVQLDGAPVRDGTVITAIIEGDIYTTTTPAAYGKSTYALKIVPPEGTFYNEGTQISFKIGDYDAVETATWEGGGNIELSLTASTAPAPTPTPPPLPTPTPTLTPSPTPTPMPTLAPTTTPTPMPQETKTSLNMGRVIGLAIFGIVDALLIGLVLYMGWRFFVRPQE